MSRDDWSYLFDGKPHTLTLGEDYSNPSYLRCQLQEWKAVMVKPGWKLTTKLIGDKMLVKYHPLVVSVVCEGCGKPFDSPYSRTRKLCSRSCMPRKPGDNTIKAIGLWNDQGMSQKQISDELGVTRARVGQILHRFKDQLTTPISERRWKRPPKEHKCKRCGKDTGRKTRTYCSTECFRAYLNLVNGRWSRHTVKTYVCQGCGKSFERSNYRHAISQSAGARNTYCTRDCFIQSGGPWATRRK